jgi:hypothetical protein
MKCRLGTRKVGNKCVKDSGNRSRDMLLLDALGKIQRKEKLTQKDKDVLGSGEWKGSPEQKAYAIALLGGDPEAERITGRIYLDSLR